MVFRPNESRSPLEQAIAELVVSGCPPEIAEWLAAVLLDPEVIPPEDATTSTEDLGFPALCRLQHFGDALRGESDHELAILKAFDGLLGGKQQERTADVGPWRFTTAEAQRFLTLCKGHLEFEDILLKIVGSSRQPLELARTLVHVGAVSPANLIDWKNPSGSGSKSSWWPRSHGSSQAAREEKEPTTLLFWLASIGAPALDPAILRIKQADHADAVELARSAGWCIGSWMMHPQRRGSIHPTSYRELGLGFAVRASQIFDLFDGRIGANTENADPDTREMWLRYAWMSFDGIPPDQEEMRERLHRAASDEIEWFGRLFQLASTTDARTRFESLRDHYDCCVHLLLTMGTLWDALEPLLNAFRDLGAQALAPDLRCYWDAHIDGREIPSWVLWSVLPGNVLAAILNYSAQEQECDPDLQSVRDGFATWCLEQLVPNAHSEGDNATGRHAGLARSQRTEDDPTWRACLLYAFKELRTDCSGHAHEALAWLIRHDSDEDIRKEAQVASSGLQKGSGSIGTTPQAALLAAFWWLRQAHVVSRGIELDEAGAVRLRDQERRWTAEPEGDEGEAPVLQSEARQTTSTRERGQYSSCFISFCAADEEFADRLYSDFKAAGVRCWKWDDDARTGRSLWGEIDTEIGARDKLVLIASRSSLESPAVNREIERAIQVEDDRLRKKAAGIFKGDPHVLFPVRVDDFILDGWIHERKVDVNQKVIADATRWSKSDQEYEKIRDKLLEHLSV